MFITEYHISWLIYRLNNICMMSSLFSISCTSIFDIDVSMSAMRFFEPRRKLETRHDNRIQEKDYCFGSLKACSVCLYLQAVSQPTWPMQDFLSQNETYLILIKHQLRITILYPVPSLPIYRTHNQ